jgi:predicted acyl esterase
VPDTSAQHVACARYAPDFVDNAALMWNGDRTPYWQERDYRSGIKKSHVPIFITNGLTSGEGHILQFDGLWDLVPTDQKRMMLGQHGHAYPTGVRADFPAMQVAWLDHYLRGGPALVEPGVVEYQDDTKAWHESERWPPVSDLITLRLSDRTLVPDAAPTRASSQSFQSGTTNPTTTECRPFQALYVSPPLKERVLLAGNFLVNLTLTSTLPDGNLAAFLYHTKGPGTCPDAEAREVRRALTDLRHPAPGAKGADFPLNQPTAVSIRSHPFASIVEAGERLVLVVGGESSELHPEVRKPVLTVTTGPNLAATVTLPVVEGHLVFA